LRMSCGGEKTHSTRKALSKLLCLVSLLALSSSDLAMITRYSSAATKRVFSQNWNSLVAPKPIDGLCVCVCAHGYVSAPEADDRMQQHAEAGVTWRRSK
jgi:hypothetical protein